MNIDLNKLTKEDFINNDFKIWTEYGGIISKRASRILPDIGPVDIWKLTHVKYSSKENKPIIKYFMTKDSIIGYRAINHDVSEFEANKIICHYSESDNCINFDSENAYVFHNKKREFFMNIELGIFKCGAYFINKAKSYKYVKDMLYKDLSQINQKILKCDLELLNI